MSRENANHPRILVVDDDAGQLFLTCESLEQGGFTVVGAESGPQALAFFQAEQPDIVLLDVVMPGMDGFSVCAALRKLPGGEHVPIIIVTSLDDIQSIERAYEAGVTDFITKPLQWLVLQHRVRYILRANQVLRAFRESEERFRSLVQAAGSAILVLDRQRRIQDLNRAAERLYLCDRGDLLGKDFLSLFSAEEAPLRDDDDIAKVFSGEPIWNAESTVRHGGGERRIVLWNITRFEDSLGNPTGLVAIGQDITVRKRAEESLRKLSHAVEQNPISILITDTHGNIEYANPRFTQVSGYALEEIQGKDQHLFEMSTLTTEDYRRLWQTIAQGDIWCGELCNRRKNGELFWESAHVSGIKNTQGTITNYIWLKEDITDKKQAEEKIRFLAYYDSLTGLPNRVRLHEQLQQLLEHARIEPHLLAILFLDLDRFKQINDSLGHRAGDLLLQQVAIRLQECLRSSDYVSRLYNPSNEGLLARLGGDEFVILLTEVSHFGVTAKIAERILAMLAEPFVIDSKEVFTSASIGISIYPQDGMDADTLLKNADTALYHAKDQGRNNYQLYSDWMNTAALRRLAMESQLRKALERGEFSLYYQPQVELGSNQVVAVEALLRWHNQELGMVSPQTFIEVAEETGLIISIGEWVLKTACAQAKAWQEAGFPGLRLAVNLSPRQLIAGALPAMVARVLRETGLEPDYLELEITESVIMKEGMIDILNALKTLGVTLAIDDFGTGYSNLGYLKRFPIDRLKIDRSFIRDISSEAHDAAIALAVIAMARSLRLKVVAEGVETEDQLAFLKSNQCDEMQGYYFSPPQPPEALLTLLRKHSPAGFAVTGRAIARVLLRDELI